MDNISKNDSDIFTKKLTFDTLSNAIPLRAVGNQASIFLVGDIDFQMFAFPFSRVFSSDVIKYASVSDLESGGHPKYTSAFYVAPDVVVFKKRLHCSCSVVGIGSGVFYRQFSW